MIFYVIFEILLIMSETLVKKAKSIYILVENPKTNTVNKFIGTNAYTQCRKRYPGAVFRDRATQQTYDFLEPVEESFPYGPTDQDGQNSIPTYHYYIVEYAKNEAVSEEKKENEEKISEDVPVSKKYNVKITSTYQHEPEAYNFWQHMGFFAFIFSVFYALYILKNRMIQD